MPVWADEAEKAGQRASVQVVRLLLGVLLCHFMQNANQPSHQRLNVLPAFELLIDGHPHQHGNIWLAIKLNNALLSSLLSIG